MQTAQQKNVKTKGTRKHLNFLIEDLLVEYQETVRTHNKELAGLPQTPDPVLKIIEDQEAESVAAVNKPPNFLHPYLIDSQEGKIVAHEFSKKVNTKRTPSGNFFQVANPALQANHLPGGGKAVMSVPNTPGASHESKTPTPPPQQSAPAAAAQARQQAEASWLTAQQKGDRFAGMKNAKMVNNKRTPSGGFFLNY